MKPLSSLDYFQSRRCYGDVTLDLASLTDFYLPLVGTDAFSVYLALSREEENTSTHKELIALLNLTLGELENALARLEAVGLIRTFFQEEGKTRLFVYCLYAPLHAAEFNADIMLSGTLKGKIGEEAYKALLARHEGKDGIRDMEEISASFPEVFKPSYDAKFYLSSSEKTALTGKASPKTGFDSLEFMGKLERMGLRKGALSQEELRDVGKIAALYRLDEATMAELAYGCLRSNAPIGKKLDREALSRQASNAMPFDYLKKEKGESSGVKPVNSLTKKIALMDEMPPARFLSVRQGGHKPASADLKIIERLSLQIGLPDPCINALLDYVLATKDNQLPAPYCEKLAASLVREGCRSSRDAMDYLMRTRRKRKKGGDEDPLPPEEIPVTPKVKPEQKDESVSDAELDALFKDTFGDKK